MTTACVRFERLCKHFKRGFHACINETQHQYHNAITNVVLNVLIDQQHIITMPNLGTRCLILRCLAKLLMKTMIQTLIRKRFL